jgi:hypothetical protein
VGLPEVLTSDLPPAAVLVMAASAASVVVLLLFLRGLLPLAVALSVNWMLNVLPLNPDLQDWTGQPARVVLALLAGACLYAFRAARRS